MTKRKNRNPKAAIFCFVWNGRDAINRVSTRLFREFADQIPVAVGIVDAGDVREVLVLHIALHREACLLTAEGEFPLVSHQQLGGVRSVADDVVVVSAKGISQSLIAQYISGKKKACKASMELFLNSIHKVGQELVAV